LIDFETIYREHAWKYDELVAHEDVQGNLRRTLRAICPLEGVQVVELGAGTGRLTRLLAPIVGSILATDRSEAMLKVATARLQAQGARHWALVQGDNRALPLRDGIADLVLAGWSLGHSVGWYPEAWPREIDLALREMRRVARPGGWLVIIETLGTGEVQPRPPTGGLAAYYQALEQDHAFEKRWARTDYRFDSPEQAEGLVRFFFGDELGDRVASGRLTDLPECTGFWARRV
jgi:ubiquinone/menaquinone biosynthesis C-methylase UbiE